MNSEKKEAWTEPVSRNLQLTEQYGEDCTITHSLVRFLPRPPPILHLSHPERSGETPSPLLGLMASVHLTLCSHACSVHQRIEDQGGYRRSHSHAAL